MGSSPKLLQISAQAASKAAPIAFKASGPKQAPSMSCRALIAGPLLELVMGSSVGAHRAWQARLARQLANRGVMYGHGARDRAEALAGVETLQGFGALMGRELWFAPEAHALGLGGPTSIIGPPDNAMPLVLRHGTEEGDKAPAQGRREIEVGLVQNLD